VTYYVLVRLTGIWTVQRMTATIKCVTGDYHIYIYIERERERERERECGGKGGAFASSEKTNKIACSNN